MKNKSRIGTHVAQHSVGESYKAYIPPPLPPNPPLDLEGLYPWIDKTMVAIGELNTMVETIPNHSLFTYMYVRKEALLSSQIEGTQSSFYDLMLFENEKKSEVSQDEVKEVSNYVHAIYHGIDRLDSGFPLCLRLLREVHEILLSKTRGSNKMPGEFRTTQNWIGGTRPGNALFVPPPPSHLLDILSQFETFLNDTTVKLPILIKIGLAHVQFESIHPFLDGNGRLGRLLMILLLYHNKIIKHPVLYISLFLKKNRDIYYRLLQEVRTEGTWETWLEFFLEGTYNTAKEAIETTKEMHKMFERDERKISLLGRAQYSCMQTLDYLKKLPKVTVPQLAEELEVSAPTARLSLSYLSNLNIIEEKEGKSRGKFYVYRKYLTLLEKGTTPLPI